jgi:CRISPR-associated protein Cas6
VTVVDVVWPVSNRGRVPLHHQYQLFAAVSRLVPALHEAAHVGFHPIRGQYAEPGFLMLSDLSAVTIRAPLECASGMLTLSGKRLDLGGYPVRLGVPHFRVLSASTNLVSHLVTIKGYHDESITVGARKQLDALGVSTSVNLVVGQRRVLRVKQQTIVGYRLTLHGLSAEEAIAVQSHGVGGRRHLGCGLFVPVQNTESNEGGIEPWQSQ